MDTYLEHYLEQGFRENNDKYQNIKSRGKSVIEWVQRMKGEFIGKNYGFVLH